MTTIDDLVCKLRRHKAIFVPDDSEDMYKKYLWNYYSRYCELKNLGDLRMLTNVIQCAMRVHIKLDIAAADKHYQKHGSIYKIWIPADKAIDDIVRIQTTQEENTT